MRRSCGARIQYPLRPRQGWSQFLARRAAADDGIVVPRSRFALRGQALDYPLAPPYVVTNQPLSDRRQAEILVDRMVNHKRRSDKLADIGSQFAKLRAGICDECSAMRAETRDRLATARAAIRHGFSTTRGRMRSGDEISDWTLDLQIASVRLTLEQEIEVSRQAFEHKIANTRHALEEEVAHTRREQDEHRRRRAAS